MLLAILLIAVGIWAMYGFWKACIVTGCLIIAVHILRAVFRRIPIRRK